MPSDPELYLSLDEVRRLVAEKQEDCQRKANQAVRKEELKDAYAFLESVEILNQFLYACELHAGRFSPVTAEAREKQKRGIKPRASRPVVELRRRIAGEE